MYNTGHIYSNVKIYFISAVKSGKVAKKFKIGKNGKILEQPDIPL